MLLIKKVMLKVLVSCLFFSFCFVSLLPFSVANASEYEINDSLRVVNVSDHFNVVFYYDENSQIQEVYRDNVPFYSTSNSIKLNYKNSYWDSDGKASFFVLRFDLRDNSYISNQSYDLSFKFNHSNVYYSIYTFNNYQPFVDFYDAVQESFQIGAMFTNSDFDDNFKSELSNSGIPIFNSYYGNGASVRVPYEFPNNFNNNEASQLLGNSRSLFFYVYINAMGTVPNNELLISDICLIPTSSTISLYEDEIYHNDVIGDDTEGEESGLKGIVGLIKKLVSSISEGFMNLLNGILNGIKFLFIPEDTYFDSLLVEVNTLLEEHLGAIYQVPRLIWEYIRMIGDLGFTWSDNPQDLYIRFPEFNIYISGDPPEGYDFLYSNIVSDFSSAVPPDISSQYTNLILIPDNHQSDEESGYYYLRLDIFNSRPYSILYSIYKVVINVIVILAFMTYLFRKYELILAGFSEE